VLKEFELTFYKPFLKPNKHISALKTIHRLHETEKWGNVTF